MSFETKLRVHGRMELHEFYDAYAAFISTMRRDVRDLLNSFGG